MAPLDFGPCRLPHGISRIECILVEIGPTGLLLPRQTFGELFQTRQIIACVTSLDQRPMLTLPQKVSSQALTELRRQHFSSGSTRRCWDGLRYVAVHGKSRLGGGYPHGKTVGNRC